MTFGVVLFTLIVQATTMPLLLRRLKLLQGSPRQFQRDVRVGRQYAFNASWDRMQHLHREGLLTGDVWQGLQAQHAEERERLDQEMRDLFVEHSELERELIITARRESLLAERAAISEANQRGLIADEASRHLLKEVDQRLEALAVIHHMTHDVAGPMSTDSSESNLRDAAETRS
jgi:CPA1 family monovalent cation:H+ antiporter